ncbi:MAG TPA: O-antigen ligase family protein [Cyclobacteriaceae bacterium]
MKFVLTLPAKPTIYLPYLKTINLETLTFIYVLSYPFLAMIFRQLLGMDGKFIWFYYLPFVVLSIILVVHRLSIQPIKVKLLITFLVFFLIILTGTVKTYQPLPFLYFVSLLFIYHATGKINSLEIYWIKVLFILVLIISFIQIPFDFFYTYANRFKGYGLSPTTFGIYTMAFYLFVCRYFTRSQNVILYSLLFVLIIITKTRLNILFFSIIPFVFIFSQNKLLRKLFVLSFLVVIIFTYPVYNFLTSTSIGDKIIESRYESGDDASARLRLMLFGTIVNEASTMNFSDHLMGLGSEHSRLLIEKEFLYDIQPHNDFIRIYVDFGIIFTVIFLSLYYRFSITSNQLALLFCLYLLSFFHNMIYNYYIPTLIFIFDNLHRKKLSISQTKPWKTLMR